MALTNTTLAAACGPSDLTLSIASTLTGFPAVGAAPAAQPLRIDSEMMFIVSTLVAAAPGTIRVRSRGTEGFAVAHDVGAGVATSSIPSDFNVAGPIVTNNEPTVDNSITLGQDQTIIAPVVSTTYFITKGSAAAITLLGNPAAPVGVVLTFIATTAFTHAITYAPGFAANGAPSDLASFSGSLPACLVAEMGPAGQIYANSLTSNVTLG